MDKVINYLTGNMYMTRDEVLIVDLLSDHHEMPTKYEEDRVMKFFSGNDFHLVLYFANPDDRGFQMFVVRDFSLHTDELFILRDIFQQLMSQGYSPFIFSKAHHQVESLIYMSGTFRAMVHRGTNEENL